MENQELFSYSHYAKDTIFRIASMTKPITVVAALMLMEEGKFALDDPVSKFFPCFGDMKVVVGGTKEEPLLEEPKVAVTIRHLMSCTSGLTYGGLFGTETVTDQILREVFAKDLPTLFRDVEGEDFVQKLSKGHLAFQPGTKWNYSLSFDVVALLVEKVSGQTIEHFCQQRIFKPLKMDNTSFMVDESKRARVAPLTKFRNGHAHEGYDGPEPFAHDREPKISGGGALMSTVEDYSRLLQCLVNGGTANGVTLLKESTVDEMTRNQLPDNKDMMELTLLPAFSESYGRGLGYGLGVSVLLDETVAPGARLSSKGEYGWGGLYSTWFFVDPKQRLFGIMCSQLSPSSAYPVRPQFRYLAHKLAAERKKKQ